MMKSSLLQRHLAFRFLASRVKITPPITTVRSIREWSSEDPSSSSSTQTEWMPPDRPLAGDKGQSHVFESDQATKDLSEEEKELQRLEEELRRIEQEEESETDTSPLDQDESSVDWLQTRRTVLAAQDGLDLMKPDEASSRKHNLSDIKIKKHMLLSKDEIATCLVALGGRDVTIILDDPNNRRMGGAMGIIVATASNSRQLRLLADTLVRQMRRRELQHFGVLGAEQGPEGTEDPQASWLVVDCMNYSVHLQDDKTRKAIDLEGLWSGRDGLHQLDYLDEEAIEDYVAANPVPADYGLPSMDWDEKLKQLEKNRWTAPHRRVIPSKSRRRGGRIRRR